MWIVLLDGLTTRLTLDLTKTLGLRLPSILPLFLPLILPLILPLSSTHAHDEVYNDQEQVKDKQDEKSLMSKPTNLLLSTTEVLDGAIRSAKNYFEDTEERLVSRVGRYGMAAMVELSCE